MTDTPYRNALRELEGLSRGGYRLQLPLTPQEALMLAGRLQLACRHPANDGPSGAYGRDLVESIKLFFRNSPNIAALIDRGWHEGIDT